MDLERLAAATEHVGDRWSLLLVGALTDGPLAFQQLQDLLGISPAVLSARLKDLEGAGLVVGRPYQDRPVRFAYELTGRAAALTGALEALAAWAGGEVVHDACGTAAELQWWCPTCEVRVDADHAALHHL